MLENQDFPSAFLNKRKWVYSTVTESNSRRESFLGSPARAPPLLVIPESLGHEQGQFLCLGLGAAS